MTRDPHRNSFDKGSPPPRSSRRNSFVPDGDIKEHLEPIRNTLIYLVFMVFYLYSTTGGLSQPDIFFFGDQLRGQFTEVEMLEEHSPSWGKTFNDVATVEEFWHWMLGAFSHTVFSPNTFDGDPEWAFMGGKPQGYTLGYGKILGGVRIGQVRAQKRPCNSDLPSDLTQNFTWYCFGRWQPGRHIGWDNQFDLSQEDVSQFGLLKKFNYSTSAIPDSTGRPPAVNGINASVPFLFDGLNGVDRTALPSGTVMNQRSKLFSSFTTPKWNTYPVPAYSVTFDPLMGRDAASTLIKDMWRSKWIDLQTRAVFVDLSVYSPMLDRLCWCRMTAEITAAGGVMTSSSFEVLRLWEYENTSDWVNMGVTCVVFLFYCYYLIEEIRAWRKLGTAAYFASMVNVIQLLNIFFWAVATTLKYLQVLSLPPNIYVTGAHFNDFMPAVQFKKAQICVQATNVFLNWFKGVALISYAPQFGVMTETLARAGKGVSGFGVIFFIVLFGFAQAHALVFHGQLSTMRTLGQTIFSLMRSLLGDFDFDALQDADPYMGPALFIMFVCIAVFVVLNMLIAIISDAYEAAQETMHKRKPVHFTRELAAVAIGWLPGAGNCARKLADGQLCGSSGGGDAKIHTELDKDSVWGGEGTKQQDPLARVDPVIMQALKEEMGQMRNEICAQISREIEAEFDAQQAQEIIREQEGERIEAQFEEGKTKPEKAHAAREAAGHRVGAGAGAAMALPEVTAALLGDISPLVEQQRANANSLDRVKTEIAAIRQANAFFLDAVQGEMGELRHRQEGLEKSFRSGMQTIVDMTAGLAQAVAERGKQGDAAIAGAMGGVMGAMLEIPGAHPYKKRNDPQVADGSAPSAGAGLLEFMKGTRQKSTTSRSHNNNNSMGVGSGATTTTSAALEQAGTTVNAAALSPPNLQAAGIIKLQDLPPTQQPQASSPELPGAPPI